MAVGEHGDNSVILAGPHVHAEFNADVNIEQCRLVPISPELHLFEDFNS